MELRELFDESGEPIGPFPVWGRADRYLAPAELIRSGDQRPVAELVQRLRRQSLLLSVRPTKVVLDER